MSDENEHNLKVGDKVTGGIFTSTIIEIESDGRVLVEYSNGERSWWHAHELTKLPQTEGETR